MDEVLFGRGMAWYKERGAAITAAEIHQQPRLWRQLAGLIRSQSEETARFIDELKAEKNLRVVFTGAGSSAFIGESLEMMLGDRPGIRCEAVPTTDIVSAPNGVLFDVPTLLVSFSRSGESPESMAALQYAAKKVKRLYNLVAVCKKGSSLAGLAAQLSHTLVLDLPPESSDAGFAMTGSVSCMALAVYCFFNWPRREDFLRYIEKLADEAEDEMPAVNALAQKIAVFGYDRLVYLGSGALKGLAREGAVKSLELTCGKVNAVFDSSMGFRHGPKAVVNASTLTVHFVSPLNPTGLYDIDFIKEILATKRENRLAAVAPDTAALPDGADYTLRYALTPGGFNEMTAYIKGLLFAQLLSLEKSLAGGTYTDSPSADGEINRVVQGVTIHELN